MNSTTVIAYAFPGYLVCPECITANDKAQIEKGGFDAPTPVFLGEEFAFTPTCDVCEKEIDEVTLIDEEDLLLDIEPPDPEPLDPSEEPSDDESPIVDDLFSPGVVSEGTLRTQDLLKSFTTQIETYGIATGETLGRLLPECVYFRLLSIPLEYIDWEAYYSSSTAEDDLDQITGFLEDNAPEGHYFGTLGGDGACFGFFKNESDSEL